MRMQMGMYERPEGTSKLADTKRTIRLLNILHRQLVTIIAIISSKSQSAQHELDTTLFFPNCQQLQRFQILNLHDGTTTKND